MVKSINIDETMLREIELAIKGLNLKVGDNLYDFSSIVRIAINQYLKSDEIKQIINKLEADNDMLYIAESSLSKDWLNDEEDNIWKDL